MGAAGRLHRPAAEAAVPGTTPTTPFSHPCRWDTAVTTQLPLLDLSLLTRMSRTTTMEARRLGRRLRLPLLLQRRPPPRTPTRTPCILQTAHAAAKEEAGGAGGMGMGMDTASSAVGVAAGPSPVLRIIAHPTMRGESRMSSSSAARLTTAAAAVGYEAEVGRTQGDRALVLAPLLGLLLGGHRAKARM